MEEKSRSKYNKDKVRHIWAHQPVLPLTFTKDWVEPAKANTETGGSQLNASHVTTDLIKSLIQPFLCPNVLWI